MGPPEPGRRAEADAAPATACPACRIPLELHLPSIDEPDRLLGVCDRCRSWFLVDGRAAATPRPPGRLS